MPGYRTLALVTLLLCQVSNGTLISMVKPPSRKSLDVGDAMCGNPGRPAYGRFSLLTNVSSPYNEGDTVYYQCNSGYYMKGRAFRRCLSSGIWSGDLPVCGRYLLTTQKKV